MDKEVYFARCLDRCAVASGLNSVPDGSLFSPFFYVTLSRNAFSALPVYNRPVIDIRLINKGLNEIPSGIRHNSPLIYYAHWTDAAE